MPLLTLSNLQMSLPQGNFSRSSLKNHYHSRIVSSGMFLSGFPLTTCGNDNYSMGCVVGMTSRPLPRRPSEHFYFFLAVRKF
jgi:hypothetical protein